MGSFDKLTAYLNSDKTSNEPACADNASDWQKDLKAERDKSREELKQSSRELDAKLQAQRDYDQRDRLAADEDRRQSMIQGQMNQLNMNTVPRY
jgi:Skp family chaperone for outer membrane proteins